MVEFRYMSGAVYILENPKAQPGMLRKVKRHSIDLEFIKYHREHYKTNS